jgi:hypothetical protein
MQLIDLLNIANRGYPDEWLSFLYHKQTGETLADADEQGDTLALFIVRELTEVFDPTNASDVQLYSAIGVMTKARDDLAGVVAALEKALGER